MRYYQPPPPQPPRGLREEQQEGFVPKKSYLDGLTIEQLRKMVECDCVPVAISSKSCPNCGRRAVVSQDFFLDIVKELSALKHKQPTKLVTDA